MKKVFLAILFTPMVAFAFINDANDLRIEAGETKTLSGTLTYNRSVVINGTLNITGHNDTPGTGFISLNAPVIHIHGHINGKGKGYRGGASGGFQPSTIMPSPLPSNPGQGPGGGAAGTGTSASKIHGGAGNYYLYGTDNGPDIAMGSGGGGGYSHCYNPHSRPRSTSTVSSKNDTNGVEDVFQEDDKSYAAYVCCRAGNGGAGGAYVALNGTYILIDGTIDVSGADGVYGECSDAHQRNGGNGSGGGILILGAALGLTHGGLLADGGKAPDSASWGGRVKLFSTWQDFNRTSISVNDGGSFRGNDSASSDWDGNGEPDIFQDFDGNGTPDCFQDFNGNGLADVAEDFNGNGIPDALEDFDGDGRPDLFYVGRVAEAYQDGNGNGVPDAFESNGAGFLDLNNDGIRDLFSNRPPVAAVVQDTFDLLSQYDVVEIDGTPTRDPDRDNRFLFYSWREDPRNPILGLVPFEADTNPKPRLIFPEGGRYIFNLVASDGIAPSDQDTASPGAQGPKITVNVPGIRGSLYALPSFDTVRLADVEVALFASASDATSWQNPLDADVSSSRGLFSLYGLGLSQGQNLSAVVGRRKTNYSDAHDNYTLTSLGIRKSLGMSRGVLNLLEGVVSDGGGAPLRGVQVMILAGMNLNGNTDTTDSQGTFQCVDVQKGSWTVQLIHDKGAEARPIQIIEDVRPAFTLQTSEALGSLSGDILSQGSRKGIPNVNISLGGGAFSATSDAKGRYTIDRIPVGTYVAWAVSPGWSGRRDLIVSIAPGDNTHDFILTPSGEGPALFGEVRDSQDGRLVSGASVSIVGYSNVVSHNVSTDRTGYFMIRNAPQGQLKLVVSAPAYEEMSLDVDVADASVGRLIQVTRKSAWSHADAFVFTSSPLAQLSANKTELAGVGDRCTLTAAKDTNFIPGTMALRWVEDSRNPAFGSNIPQGFDAAESWEFLPKRPGLYHFSLDVLSTIPPTKNKAHYPVRNWIEIFVPGLDGQVCVSPSGGVYPATGIQVRIFNSYNEASNWENPVSTATSEDDGSFSFTGLARGNYWVAARDAQFLNYGPVRRCVQPGSTVFGHEVNMKKESYLVSGVVTDSNTGLPLEGVSVTVSPGVQSEICQTSTFTDGRYYLQEVPRGTNQFFLYKEGYAPVSESQAVFEQTDTLNFSLEKSTATTPAFLRGKVLCQAGGNQYPLARAEVIIAGGIAEAITDQNGDFLIANLVPGWYAGLIRKDGYVTQLLGVTSPLLQIPEEGRDQNYVLSFENRGPRFTGTIADAGGAPLPNVQIIVLPPRDDKGGPLSGDASVNTGLSQTHAATTDAAGRFILADVPHGPRTLQLVLAGGEVYERMFYVEDDMELTLESFKLQTSIEEEPLVAERPVFAPAPGTYTSPQELQILCSMPDATIRYTTDGTDPDTNAALYTAPISLQTTTVLKARAWKDGWTQSDVITGAFQLETVAEGEGEPPLEGEGELVVEGEGETPTEGEGEVTTEGEGEITAEGEGETHTEGEGEIPAEGEGEVTAEGEGEIPAEGEGEVTAEGEGETPHEGEGEVTPEGEGETPHEGEGEVTPEGEGECEKPAAPKNVTVRLVEGEAGRLDLSWDTSARATGYKIYRRPSGSAEAFVFIGETNTNTFTDTNAPAGAGDYAYPDGCFAESLDCTGCINSENNPGCYYTGHYYGQEVEYWVTAYNACGESLPSQSASTSAWKNLTPKSLLLRHADSLLFLGVLASLAAFSRRFKKGLPLQ